MQPSDEFEAGIDATILKQRSIANLSKARERVDGDFEAISDLVNRLSPEGDRPVLVTFSEHDMEIIGKCIDEVFCRLSIKKCDEAIKHFSGE